MLRSRVDLDSPEWLEPLAARGLFRKPPPPEKVGGYVRLPFWPESRYLVRMAAIPEVQATVVRIAREIPKTKNSRVYDDIIDMALALPGGPTQAPWGTTYCFDCGPCRALVV